MRHSTNDLRFFLFGLLTRVRTCYTLSSFWHTLRLFALPGRFTHVREHSTTACGSSSPIAARLPPARSISETV